MNSATYTLASLMLAAAVASYGCGRDEPERADAPAAEAPATRDAAPASNAEMSVADIVGSPDRFFGQTVTVVADVEEVHTPMSFTLDEDAPLQGGVDNDLLVFSPKAANLASIDDQWMNNKVRVTGKVGKMSVVEIEREIGWDLNPEIEAEVERARAVLIATSIQRVEGNQGTRNPQ
jgi:hypothetical protein